MTEPEDFRTPPEVNTENLGNKTEENMEVGLIEKPESRENSPDHQTENVKNGSDENTRKRKLDIEEDESNEKTKKRKVDFEEKESEVRDSNRGRLNVQRSFEEKESEVRDSNRGPLNVQRSFIPKGIKNVSETCFINVALQCLLVMDNIRERFMKPSDQLSDSNLITNQICNLLAQRYLMGSPEGEVPDPSEAPTELQNKLYRGLLEKNHSGATILKIVTGLDEENEGLKAQEGSEIRPLMEDFMISFQTKVTCSSCGHEGSLPLKNEGMLNVNLLDDEVSKLPQLSDKWLQKLVSNGPKWLRLEALLPFIELHNMNDTHSECCRKGKFEISIKKAPRVLVVSWLAQVRPNPGDIVHLSEEIEFEKYLDLSKFVSRNCMRRDDYKYRLIAVADFQGPVEVDPTKQVVGHTSAFVLGSKYGQDNWIHFNDAVVTQGIEESQVLNVTHWVSVYERENSEIDLNKPLNDDESRRLRVEGSWDESLELEL